jgi:hypothetical protein
MSRFGGRSRVMNKDRIRRTTSAALGPNVMDNGDTRVALRNRQAALVVARTARHIAMCALAVTCGCFPAMTHGARIEDGFIVGLTGAVASGATHVEGDEGGIRLREPVLGPFIGYGSAPSRRDVPRFYVGAAVPVLFLLAQVDAYMQLPPAWTGPLAVGAGGVASFEGATGYALVGGEINPSTAWHVGGGYGRRNSSSTSQSSSPAWVGSAAVEMARGYLRTQIFLQAASGEIPGQCFDNPVTRRSCSRGEHSNAAALGISLGRHQRNRKP